jgi:predicted  nucleic acid-binding Zn-ribbon protein
MDAGEVANESGGLPDEVQEQKIIAKMYLDYLSDLMTICLDNNIKLEPSLTKVQKRSIGLKSTFINSHTRDQFLDITESAQQTIYSVINDVVKNLVDTTQHTEEQVLDLSDLGLDLSECKIILEDILDQISEVGEEKMPPLKVISKAYEDLTRVREIAHTKNEEYDNIVKEISRAERLIENLKKKGFDTIECDKVLDNANIALLTENFKSAFEQANKAFELAKKLMDEGPKEKPKPEIEATAEEIERMLPQINELHKEVAVKLELLKAKGMEISKTEKILTNCKKLVMEKDYKTAINDLLGCKVEVDNSFYEEINKIIKETAEMIRKAPSYIILTEPMNYLNRASQMLIDNDYINAYENARKSMELVNHLKEEYQSILKITQLCEVKVKALRKEHLDLTQIELTLNQAKEALKKGEHKMAIERANDALLQIEESKKPLLEKYKDKVNEQLEIIEPMITEVRNMGINIRDLERTFDDLLTTKDEAMNLEDYKQVVDFVFATKAEVARAIRRTEYNDRIAEAKYRPLKEKYDHMVQFMSLPGVKKSLDKIQEAMIANNRGEISENIKNIEELLKKAEEEYFPEFSCEIHGEDVCTDAWCNMTMSILNFGQANANDVNIKLTGEFEMNQEPYPLNLSFGESYSIPLNMKFKDDHDIVINVSVEASRQIDDTKMVFKGSGKIFRDKTGKFTTSSIPLDLHEKGAGKEVTLPMEKPGEEAGEEEKEAVTCTMCKMEVVGKTPHVNCGCGAAYHIACFSKLTYCLECGMNLNPT